MKRPTILMTGTTDKTGSAAADQRFAAVAAKTDAIASVQAWFAGGERIGYDPKARAIVGENTPELLEGAPLRFQLQLRSYTHRFADGHHRRDLQAWSVTSTGFRRGSSGENKITGRSPRLIPPGRPLRNQTILAFGGLVQQ
jgi:hypothetical protein